MTDTLKIDNSTLSKVGCSTAVLLRYGLGYTTPNEKAILRAGSAGHESLACYFKGGTPKQALDVLEKEYREFAEEEVLAGDKLCWDNVLMIQQEWFVQHPIAKLPFKIDPDLIEIGFACPLTEEITFVGRMDGLVFGAEDNRPYILENKFTGRISDYWVKKFRSSSQITGYIWAAEQHLGKSVVGAFINGIQHSKLPFDPVRKCKNHGTVYAECGPLHMTSQILITQRSPWQIEEWKKTAVHLAKRFQNLKKRWGSLELLHKVRMQGTFDGSCGFCEFDDFCSAGRPLNLVQSMLVHSPWEPFKLKDDPGITSGTKP